MLQAPVVGDAIFARLAEQLDFDAVMVGGGFTAQFLYGLPDMGIISIPEVIENVRRVTAVIDLPVIADLDDAGGTPGAIRRNVRMAESAGAAVISVEDTDMTAKHFWSDDAKGWDFSMNKVIPLERAAGNIRTAVEARRDSETLILGRTDSYPALGLEEALERAQRFAAAGADLIYFAEMPHEAITAEVIAAVPVPVIHFELDSPSVEDSRRLEEIGVKLLGHYFMPMLGAYEGFRSALEDIKNGRPSPKGPGRARNAAVLETVDSPRWTRLAQGRSIG